MSEQQNPNKRKRRRVKKSVKRFFVLVIALGIMAGLSFVITGFIQGSFDKDNDDDNLIPGVTPPPAQSGSSSIPDISGIVTAGDGIDPASWNFVGPLQQVTDEMVILSPDYRMLSVPENGRVDMRYFDTTVFVGDSITQGLEIFTSGIPNAKYCAYKSASPKAIYDGSILTTHSGRQEVPLDAMVEYQPDNVYVLMGTNAMVAMGDEALLAYYSDMLDAMRERLHPDVTIYIQSITPTSQGADGRFGKDRIAGLNNALAQMAWEKGMYFIDLHEALAGEDGWLRPEFTQSDGYHITPLGYTAWVDYLVTHTVYKPMHAGLYLEGSEYYSQIEPPQKEEEPPADEEPPAEPEE